MPQGNWKLAGAYGLACVLAGFLIHSLANAEVMGAAVVAAGLLVLGAALTFVQRP